MANKTICVDNALFLKLSKKLKKDNSLQETQEELAKAFGFRNLSAIQTYFNTQNNTIENKITQIHNERHHESFLNRLQHLSQAQTLKLCTSLVPKSNDMWYEKAINLLDIVTQYFYLEQNADFTPLMSAASLQETLLLDNLIKIYKNRRDLPQDFRSLLRAYLMLLPGFQESSPKQTDRVMEQHGYNLMPLGQMLRKFTLLEKEDVLLFSMNWMLWDDNSNVDKMSVLKNYQTLGAKLWADKITELDPQYSFGQKDMSYVSFLSYRDDILYHEAFENSWLNYPMFMTLILSKFRNRTISDIYLSDLLFDFANVVNPLKQNQIQENISYFIQNIEQTKKISAIIQSIQ